MLNSLSPEEWENLGLDEVLTSSPLQNIQLPELQSGVSPLARELELVSAPPCEVDSSGVGHQGDEVCANLPASPTLLPGAVVGSPPLVWVCMFIRCC